MRAMGFQVLHCRAEILGLKLLVLDPGHPSQGNPEWHAEDPDTVSEEILMTIYQSSSKVKVFLK